MDSNEAMKVVPKCECGAAAVKPVAFRAARILCQRCFDEKSMKFLLDDQFLVDALTVIANTTGLKSTTIEALREIVIARTQL